MTEDIKEQLSILYQCDKELNDFYHDYIVNYGKGLSETAFWLLYIICDMSDNCTQSDICDCWSYKRQSANSALKRLEAQGYLQLKAIPNNKKSKHIVLTEEGHALVEEVIIPWAKAELKAFEEFDEQERKLLIKLTQKRIAAIRENVLNELPR